MLAAVCAVAVLAALLAREKTGAGQYLDIAMSEGVLYMLTGMISNMLAQGVSPKRGGTTLNGGAPYYNVYQTKDGGYLSIAAIEPWFWENLCRSIGREDLVPHQKASGPKREEIVRTLEVAFGSKTRDEWFEFLKDRNISVGKVYSLEEALDDPHAVHRGMVLEVEAPHLPEGKVRQVGIPIHLSETPGAVRHLGPVTGEHTAEVMAALGFSDDRISQLQQRGVVQ